MHREIKRTNGNIASNSFWGRARASLVLTLLALATLSGAVAQSDDDFPSFEALMKDGAGREQSPLSDDGTTLRPANEATPPRRRGRFRPKPLTPEQPEIPGARFPIPGASRRGGGENVLPSPFNTREDAEAQRRKIKQDEEFSRSKKEAQTAQLKFDWTKQTTSIADLRLPGSALFVHGDAFLTPKEESAYLDLLDSVAAQRRRLIQKTSNETTLQKLATNDGHEIDAVTVSAKGTSIWQEAFYEFPNARRLAWNNGHLRAEAASEGFNGLPDPFVSRNAAESQATDAPYRLIDDMRRFPEHFTGRPVVLFGRFTAKSVVRMEAAANRERRVTERRPGDIDPPANTVQRKATLMRGSLTALNGTELVAMVDAKELVTPQSGSFTPENWPRQESTIAVLVKGWVVKQWGRQPLVYCESMRQVSPIPHYQLVRRNTIDKSRVRDEEKWLYYETLAQMRLASPRVQREVAATVQRQRIDELMQQVKTKADAEMVELNDQMAKGTISEPVFRQQRVSLQRRLGQRVARYRQFRKKPEEFETYVDLFQHPDFWHGHLVTLRGHVRHVMSYPSDEILFPNRKLHELWLFTEDSQNNPAVIITPELPPGFPTDAEVIERVSVTGCFFKRYVYGSQDTDRVAPLLLAGGIRWRPTVDQVQSLVDNGKLSAKSPRAIRAAALGKGLSDTAIMMLCGLVVLVFMILWGRAQREERDRVRLRKRVNDVPEYSTPQLPDFVTESVPTEHDYGSNY